MQLWSFLSAIIPSSKSGAEAESGPDVEYICIFQELVSFREESSRQKRGNEDSDDDTQVDGNYGQE